VGTKNQFFSHELGVVQDADRLDAIGAIGIARAFTFGGSRKRPLWDPTEELPKEGMLSKEQYMNRNTNTLDHFYVKLLHLKGMMKTPSGKRRAELRHKYMEDFVDQFRKEWQGSA